MAIKRTGSHAAFRPVTQPAAAPRPASPRAPPADAFTGPTPSGASPPASHTIRVAPLNQRNPDGKANGNDYAATTPRFANGDGFCGPTSLLMAARALGARAPGSTAQAIVNLAVAGKYADGAGVPPANFRDMAATLGLQLVERSGAGPNGLLLPKAGGGYELDHEWLRGQLAAGRPVIFNVDTNGAAAGGGHYQLLVGFERSPARYTFVNPWDGAQQTLTAEQLRAQVAGGNLHAFAVAPR